VLLVVVGGVNVDFVLREVVGINIVGNLVVELRVVVGAVDNLFTILPLNFGS
jgi:hypothetical protein